MGAQGRTQGTELAGKLGSSYSFATRSWEGFELHNQLFKINQFVHVCMPQVCVLMHVGDSTDSCSRGANHLSYFETGSLTGMGLTK